MVVDAVEYAQWWAVGYKHINAVGYLAVVFNFFQFAVEEADEHWCAIEGDAVDDDAVVAEVVHIVGKSLQRSIKHIVVVVAGDEYLVPVRQVAKPFDEVEGFHIAACQGEVAAMHQHVGIWHIAQLAVHAVSVGKVEDGHKN